MDKIERREIILDNYQNPFHRGLVDSQDYKTGSTKSDSCIDNIEMMIKMANGNVEDAVFDGEACAICTSCTSILLKKMIGKDVGYIRDVISNFRKMINEEDYDENLLGELLAYEDLYLQPSRKNCALLPTKTILKILDEEVNDGN